MAQQQPMPHEASFWNMTMLLRPSSIVSTHRRASEERWPAGQLTQQSTTHCDQRRFARSSSERHTNKAVADNNDHHMYTNVPYGRSIVKYETA